MPKDFNIKPNIVIAYIDQTDVGDELCRYKHNRIYDDKHKLVSIKNTSYSRAVFEYTRINNISEIVLSNNSELIKNFKSHNIESYEIGHLTANPNEYKWVSTSGIEDMPIFENDELTKCFEAHT